MKPFLSPATRARLAPGRCRKCGKPRRHLAAGLPAELLAVLAHEEGDVALQLGSGNEILEDCCICEDDEPEPFPPCDPDNAPDMNFSVNGITFLLCREVFPNWDEFVSQTLNGFTQVIPAVVGGFLTWRYHAQHTADPAFNKVIYKRWTGDNCGDGAETTFDGGPEPSTEMSCTLDLKCEVHPVSGLPTGNYEYLALSHGISDAGSIFVNNANPAGVWLRVGPVVTVPNLNAAPPAYASGGNCVWNAVAPGVP